MLYRALDTGQREVQLSRERVLRSNLFTLRSLIQQYTLDKKKTPKSLNDLVLTGYLKQIPKDPTTGAADWTVDQDDSIGSPDWQNRGINDVHSASRSSASDGTAYSTW